MPVINFRITDLGGTRTEKEAGSVDVRSNFKIVSVKRDKRDDGKDFLLVNFEFDVTYKPNVGDMQLKGYLWYQEENMDKLVKDGGDKLELDPQLIKNISTTIIRESIVESLDIAKKLRLPLPLRLPRVDAEPQNMTFTKAS